MDFLREHGQITKKDAVKMLERTYYCNASKHVGVILSNMVNRKMIDRIKPGVFKKHEGHAGTLAPIRRPPEPRTAEDNQTYMDIFK